VLSDPAKSRRTPTRRADTFGGHAVFDPAVYLDARLVLDDADGISADVLQADVGHADSQRTNEEQSE
jgi:hypothetical protein